MELIKLRKINAQTIKTIVIDEMDRMMDRNNLPGVKDVIKTTLRDRQIMVFSATISEAALITAKSLMREPQFIKIEEKTLVNANISHIFFTTEQRDKIEVLRKFIAAVKPERAMIFINKSEEIKITTQKLQYHHINAYGIYGSASKEERKKALEGLRCGKIQYLVASDLAARGLDVQDITHIINLDLPEEPKEYLHRVGRTARAEKTGTAISIVTEKEKNLILKYEKAFNIKINEKHLYKGAIMDGPGIKHSKVSR